MGDAQHFCLRWNNYQSSITSAFENLRDDEDFVDVTLACDGRSLKAHRVVLSACSPYFRDLLKSTPCKHPVIVLQDVSFSDLHALVEFIYHGEVNVHQQSLSSFLKTAEVLRVSGLTQQQSEETNSHLSRIQNLANTPTRISAGHLSYAEKISDDQIFLQGVSQTSPQNNLHPSQLIRRVAAAAAMRRGERQSLHQNDDLGPLKRYRSDNGISVNKNGSDTTSNPPLTTAFSTLKQQSNNIPVAKDDKCEKLDGNGNGMPPIDNDNVSSSPLATINTEEVKSEPLEMVCANNNPPLDDHSNDSSGENDLNRSSSAGEIKGSLSSVNDEEIDNSMPCNPPQRFLMSPHDSKFLATPGTYNFSMAALADPAALASLNSQLQSAADLAGSPQAGPQNAATSCPSAAATSNTSLPLSSLTPAQRQINNEQASSCVSITSSTSVHASNTSVLEKKTSLQEGGSNHQLRMPLPTSGGINEPQECPYCRRTFSCYYSLKRHFQDKHEQSDTLYLCEFCHRRYRTKNSLTTHKSLQHRGSSGMLKRLLKTSAIKSVLGSHHSVSHNRASLFDFSADIGQPPPPPPPGIQ